MIASFYLQGGGGSMLLMLALINEHLKLEVGACAGGGGSKSAVQ